LKLLEKTTLRSGDISFFSYIGALVVLNIFLMLFFSISTAQSVEGPPPVKERVGASIEDVHEDFTTPALTSSNLKPAQPLVFFNDYPHYTVELLRVQWRAVDPIDLYVLKPKGVKKPPVIIYLYGYPTDTDVFKRTEYQELVTRNGVAAVGFVSALTGQRYHDRPMKQWFISELQESLATSAHDVQMVLNYLASRGDLDMNRVGMFTQGSGASIAILVSGVDPRIKVLEALDPWADWSTWMRRSPLVPEEERQEYLKPDFLKKVAAMEPVDVLPKIQAKKFRLDDELFDTATPRAIMEKLRSVAPAGATVRLYKDMDEFKAAFQDGKNLEWIKKELESVPGATHSARVLDGYSKKVGGEEFLPAHRE
jgi:cephalosporin-C deacetylase-like acetyl esterase